MKVWKGLNILSGKTANCESTGSEFSASELNDFYCRFDCVDFTNKVNEIKGNLLQMSSEENSPSISKELVLKSLSKINMNKAGGPDGVSPRVVKLCRYPLLKVIHFIY